MHTATLPAQSIERGRFFANATLLMAILVLLSFPLTYYLPVVTGTQSFQLLYHVHGLACLAWIGLPTSVLVTTPFLIAPAESPDHQKTIKPGEKTCPTP